MLSDHERKTLRELERQFPVGPVIWFGAHRLELKRFLLSDIRAVTSVIANTTLLAVGALGVALQPETGTGPESEALIRLHRLFVEARSL